MQPIHSYATVTIFCILVRMTKLIIGHSKWATLGSFFRKKEGSCDVGN